MNVVELVAAMDGSFEAILMHDCYFHLFVMQPDDIITGRTLREAIEAFPDDLPGVMQYWQIPRYTSDLSAVMRRLPKEHDLTLEHINTDDSSESKGTLATVWDTSDDTGFENDKRSSMENAILVGILKARHRELFLPKN